MTPPMIIRSVVDCYPDSVESSHAAMQEGLKERMALSVLNAKNEGRLEVLNQGRRPSHSQSPQEIQTLQF